MTYSSLSVIVLALANKTHNEITSLLSFVRWSFQAHCDCKEKGGRWRYLFVSFSVQFNSSYTKNSETK